MGYYDFPHTRNYDTDLGYLIDWFKTNKNKIEENTATTIEKALTATEEAIKAYNSATNASNSATNASNSAELALELKNQTEALKNLMQNKIDQIDTNTSRISNLASIDPGSVTTTADAELVDIRVSYNGITYPSAGDAVRKQVSELNNDLDSLGLTIPIESSEIEGEYIHNNGSIVQLNGFNRLEFSVEKGDIVKIRCTGYKNIVSIISQKVGNTYRSLVKSIDSNEHDYEFTAELNMILCWSYQTAYTHTIKILRPIKKIEPALLDISVFSTLTVCGDSYSEPQIWKNDTEYFTPNNLSWGMILGREKGIDVSLCAESGNTTKLWLERSSGLPKLLSEPPSQLYIVALGINDKSSITLGSLSDISGGVKENYPNTFYGNMGRIIEEIKNHAPSSKIIICKSLLPFNSNFYNYMSTAIEELANHYNIAFIETANSEYLMSALYQKTMIHGHPIAISQSGIAKTMGEMVSKLLGTNYSYFSDIIA